jgi:glycosyltransferase involved in cell wall biosynthesis
MKGYGDKNMLKVSVITITYNSSRTVRDTIQSIINQDYQNIEYIVVDGGSKDGTIDILKEYQNVITKWVSERDNGISDAFNKGIKLATGDIVLLLNSDDWLETNVIGKVVEMFETDPDTDIVHGDIRIVEKLGLEKYIEKPFLNVYENKYLGMPVRFPSVFTKAEVYRKHGLFLETYAIAMDYDIILRFINQGIKLRYLNQVITNMRDGGVSNAYFIKGYLESYKIKINHGCNKTQALRILFLTTCKAYLNKFLANTKVGKFALRKIRTYFKKGKYVYNDHL